MRQEWGSLEGRTVAWVGDFSNVARSLALGAALTGMAVRIAAPAGYGPTDDDLRRLAGLGCVPFVTVHPEVAASGADAVHTDVFTSMGQEAESAERVAALAGFQVTQEVMAAARPEAVFMHCLPAHRGEEVAAAVVDGPRSRVIEQAHNRMHAFRGLLWWLVEHARASEPA
jgi:ornithine carbamoyltransferase